MVDVVKCVSYNKKQEQIQSNINNNHEEDLANSAKIMHSLPIAIKLSIQRLPRRSAWRNRGLHQVDRNTAEDSHGGGHVSQSSQLLRRTAAAHRASSRNGAVCGHESSRAALGVIFRSAHCNLEEHQTGRGEDGAAGAERRGGRGNIDACSGAGGDGQRDEEVGVSLGGGFLQGAGRVGRVAAGVGGQGEVSGQQLILRDENSEQWEKPLLRVVSAMVPLRFLACLPWSL